MESSTTSATDWIERIRQIEDLYDGHVTRAIEQGYPRGTATAMARLLCDSQQLIAYLAAVHPDWLAEARAAVEEANRG